MVSALGRAIWNCLSQEETVVAILVEAGQMSVSKARSGDAGEKEAGLKQLRKRLNDENARPDVLEALDAGIEAFNQVRKQARNALSHAHPFTVGYDEQGAYHPGLAHTSRGVERRLADGPAELLDLAHEVEEAIEPLSRARDAVRKHCAPRRRF